MASVFEQLKKYITKDQLGYVGVVRGSYAMLLFYIPLNIVDKLQYSRITLFSDGMNYKVSIVDDSIFDIDNKGGRLSGVSSLCFRST